MATPSAGDPATLPTRILIISDTHSTPLLPSPDVQDSNAGQQPFRQPLPSADVLIHCGDMTMTGELAEYEETLDMISLIDAPTKLVIAGNHDRTLDPVWMDRNPHHLPLSLEERRETCAKAKAIWMAENGRAKREGIQYLDEGVHEVVCKNGTKLTV